MANFKTLLLPCLQEIPRFYYQDFLKLPAQQPQLTNPESQSPISTFVIVNTSSRHPEPF